MVTKTFKKETIGNGVFRKQYWIHHILSYDAVCVYSVSEPNSHPIKHYDNGGGTNSYGFYTDKSFITYTVKLNRW